MSRMTPIQELRRAAARAVLDGYNEGRPIEELRVELPEELEATGQPATAQIVRTFFRHRDHIDAGPD